METTITGHNNFVLAAKSFHGNPYDGHILAQTIESVEQLTNVKISRAFVDLGYKGNNYKEKKKIYSASSKRNYHKMIKI